MAMQEYWIAFACLWGVNWLIFLPSTTYYAVLFWTHQYLPYIKSRRPKMTMMLYVVGMINILIIRTYTAIVIILNIEYPHINLGFATNEMLFWILVYVFLMVTSFFCGRIWFFFYDWRRNEDLLKLKWAHKLLLTSVHCNDTTPWTIRYEKTLGNTKFICGVIITHYVVFVLGFLFFGSVFGLYSIAASIFMLVIGVLPPILWLIYLYIRCFRCYDAIGIRNELKHNLIIIFLTMVPFAALYMILEHGLSRHLMVDLLFAVVTAAIIIRMFRVPQLMIQMNGYMNYSKTLSSFSLNMIQHPVDNITFKELLQCEPAIKLFANHCVSEYSVDNMIFLIEYHQVKYILGHFTTENNVNKNENKSHKTTNQQALKPIPLVNNPSASKSFSYSYDMIVKSATSQWCIPFPEKLLTQKGRIKIEKTNYAKHCEIWKYLFDTYISHRSRSSINIASDIRYRIIACFQTFHDELNATDECDYKNLEIIEQYNDMNRAFVDLFDPAGKEIFDLLRRDSYVRFKTKPEYQTLKEQMKTFLNDK